MCVLRRIEEEEERATKGEIEKSEDREREEEKQWLTAPCVCVVSQQPPPPPPPPPRVDFALSRSIVVRPLFAGQLASSPSGRDRRERLLGTQRRKWERERRRRGRANRPEEQRSRRAYCLGLGFLWL